MLELLLEDDVLVLLEFSLGVMILAMFSFSSSHGHMKPPSCKSGVNSFMSLKDNFKAWAICSSSFAISNLDNSNAKDSCSSSDVMAAFMMAVDGGGDASSVAVTVGGVLVLA